MNSSMYTAGTRRTASLQSVEEPAAWVRLVDGDRSVIELKSSIADNPLYKSFRTIRGAGVDIVHAEVHAEQDGVIQRFYLVARDGGVLDRNRLSKVLATLRRAHLSPRDVRALRLQGAA